MGSSQIAPSGLARSDLSDDGDAATRDVVAHAGPAGGEVAVLRHYDVLVEPSDGAFEDAVAAAAAVFEAPCAVVALVEGDAVSFPARRGIQADDLVDLAPVLADLRTPCVVDAGSRTGRSLARRSIRFLAAAPLCAPGGRVLGCLAVMDTVPGHARAAQLDVLERLAALIVHDLELRRAARVVVAAEAELRRAADVERDRLVELSDTLRSVLLPPRLPVIPGVDLAVRYRPATSDIGGDYYDVFRIGERTWGLLIGDVCGKGPKAAVLTAAARHTIRTAASEHASPAAVLAIANEALLLGSAEREPEFFTAAYGTLRRWRDGMVATFSSGGHPLPAVLRADGRVEDVGEHGTLLGALPDVTVGDGRVFLRPGDALVLYTDGLSEAVVDGERFGRDRIRACLAGLRSGPAETVAAALEAATGDGGPSRDDLAVLVARVTPR